MDKNTQLWIRACKSKNPRVRLTSLVHRMYSYDYNKEYEQAILIANLSEIVDKYCDLSKANMMNKIFYPEVWDEDKSIKEITISVLCSSIRFTGKDKLEGLATRTKFKEKGE